ncbi:cytochrome P450 [Amycolatopsis sp. NPDC005232]|uniref:cytochrome P450 n=1 Tax=Amycolatopsis sp. NPDC005232 TaxID=3157027 RepID=UPI0033B020F0
MTGYADVVAGFRDHRRLSSDRFRGPFARDIGQSTTRYEELVEFMRKWMFSTDRPTHTRLRSLVNTAFTPRSVEQLRPRIRELVRSLGEPLRGGHVVDFMTEFAFTLPIVVISEYLGLPPESRHEVRRLSEDLGALIFVQGNTADRFANGERAMNGLVELIRPVVRARAREPRDDLISGMVHSDVDGESFTEEEVISNAALMVFAGHETTMNLLANGILAFDRSPEQWRLLQADPALARTATEEVLRLAGPIKALARWVREPFELGGRQLKKGDRVLLVQHAANHDPAAFADPERFDIRRWPNKHVAFGSGIHTCLGAPLSRLEAQEAFTYLAAEFRSIEVVSSDPRYVPTVVSHGLRELSVRFHAR